MSFLAASAGALPALAAMGWFDRLDAKRPEPRRTLRLVALAGALAVVPCALLERATSRVLDASTVAGGIVRAYLVVAVIEELAKVACVRAFAWRRPEFDERLDGIVYGSRAGLGFALLENVRYLAEAHSLRAFATTYATRALLTVPMHAVCGGLAGYYAARKRFDGAGPGLVGGYLAAVLLHGTFDAAVLVAIDGAERGSSGVPAGALAAVALLVLLGGAFLARRARRALTLDDWERRAR